MLCRKKATEAAGWCQPRTGLFVVFAVRDPFFPRGQPVKLPAECGPELLPGCLLAAPALQPRLRRWAGGSRDQRPQRSVALRRSPLRGRNENNQAPDLISFYRVVSFYGRSSKHKETVASIAPPAPGPVPVSLSLLIAPSVVMVLLSCLCL